MIRNIKDTKGLLLKGFLGEILKDCVFNENHEYKWFGYYFLPFSKTCCVDQVGFVFLFCFSVLLTWFLLCWFGGDFRVHWCMNHCKLPLHYSLFRTTKSKPTLWPYNAALYWNSGRKESQVSRVQDRQLPHLSALFRWNFQLEIRGPQHQSDLFSKHFLDFWPFWSSLQQSPYCNSNFSTF